MKTLSQKKKLGIFSLSILAMTVVGLISTGTMTMSDLRSNILGTTSPSYTCTENSHKRNLREYNQSVENQADTQEQLNTISGEITVLQNKITEHRSTITLKQATIAIRPAEIERIQALIAPLKTYIDKNCKPPRNTPVCTEKKKARADYEREIRNLKNLETDIKKLETTIRGLQGQVTNLENNRKSWNEELQRVVSFIQNYEACELSLKSKLIVTSPLMSGEMMMSGEVGTRTGLYAFSMQIPAPAQARINEIKFDVQLGGQKIELADWYVTEQGTVTSIYPCQLINRSTQLRCKLQWDESDRFGLENGRVQNYFLSAQIQNIKQSGSLEIRGISKAGITYNWSRTNIDNQTKTQKISFAPSAPRIDFEIIAPSEVIVNNPFDITVWALKANGERNTAYEGKIFFDIENSDSSVFTSLDDEYRFVLADLGMHTFKNWFTITKPGRYQLTIFELDGPNGGIAKKVEFIAKNPVWPGTLSLSLHSSTPFADLMTDNTTVEHYLAVFRLAANNVENLDVDSIKITDDGVNGNDVVAAYKFYNGATLLWTVAPDINGNAELFLTDGTLVIPANYDRLITVKAVLNDIDGVGFQNGDSLIATIAAAGDVDTTGLTSGAAIDSTEVSVDGNVKTAYEAYPLVAFLIDANTGSSITLHPSQLIAKFGLTNPGNKDVTFQSGDLNRFSIQVQTVGDDTDIASETVMLKDQNGTTLDTGTITSATGVTQIDFDMSSVGATVGTTIPAGQTKYFYIYADTSDLEDNGDKIQVWLDDTAADVTFGINGSGAYALGQYINKNDPSSPPLSRSI